MASLNLLPDEVKVLESIRQRLTQVVNSLQKFKDDVALGQPLPPAYVNIPPLPLTTTTANTNCLPIEPPSKPPRPSFSRTSAP